MLFVALLPLAGYLWLSASCDGRMGDIQSGNSFVSKVSRVSCGMHGISALQFGLEIRRLSGGV